VGPINDAKRICCCTHCAATWRNAQPGRAEKFTLWIAEGREVARQNRLGSKRPEYSARMRENNPMKNSESVAKMRMSLSGRTFLARGGNGKLTTPQILLAESLKLPMEFAIPTAMVKDKFQSLPNHYKVDIADPIAKVAIEVDGNSHKSKKWKFLDKRKTLVLNALGWSVLRFWNKEVLENQDAIALQVKAFIASKLRTTTISSPPMF
jgi:hypothetical protein